MADTDRIKCCQINLPSYLACIPWNGTGMDTNNLVSTLVQVMVWCNQAASQMWASVDLDLLTGPLGTNINEILIDIYKFSLKKINFKILSGKWWQFNVLSSQGVISTSNKTSHCKISQRQDLCLELSDSCEIFKHLSSITTETTVKYQSNQMGECKKDVTPVR